MLFGLGRHLRGIKLLADELEQDADDLIVHLAQPLGAAPAVAVLEQELLGLRARRRQRRLQTLRHCRAQFALASRISLGELFKIGDDRRAVDEFGAPRAERCISSMIVRDSGERGALSSCGAGSTHAKLLHALAASAIRLFYDIHICGIYFQLTALKQAFLKNKNSADLSEQLAGA